MSNKEREAENARNMEICRQQVMNLRQPGENSMSMHIKVCVTYRLRRSTQWDLRC